MLKNVVFDIGNVLVTFHPASYFLSYFHEEEKTNRLCDQVFQDELWLKYDQGLVFMEELEEYYRRMYPQDQEELAFLLRNWMKLMEPIKEMIDLMKELRQKGYGVYLLSNISADSAAYLKRTTEIFELAQGGILSYEVKVLKPQREIYEALFSRYALRPEECVFLDDREENIAMGRMLHMKGIVVRDIVKAKQELQELLAKEEASC